MSFVASIRRWLFQILASVQFAAAGLMALVGLLGTDRQKEPFVFILALAALLALGGFICWRSRRSRPTKQSPAPLKPQFESFRWGNPKPTRNQFLFGSFLDIGFRDGMSRSDVSRAIAETLEENGDDGPATKEQLQEIREFHGVLPRKITEGEANWVIDRMHELVQPCPHCGNDVCATDDKCLGCNRSLKNLKIPIELD